MNRNYININDMVSQYETDVGIKGALGTLATGRDSMLAIGHIDILVNNAAIIHPPIDLVVQTRKGIVKRSTTEAGKIIQNLCSPKRSHSWGCSWRQVTAQP